MSVKNLTIRVDETLYNRLIMLKKVGKTTLNQLVCEAVDRYVDEQSLMTARELQDLANQLRAYRDTDPDLKESLRSFAEAEGQASDPLEGTVVDTAGNMPHTRLQDLLND